MFTVFYEIGKHVLKMQTDEIGEKDDFVRYLKALDMDIVRVVFTKPLFEVDLDEKR